MSRYTLLLLLTLPLLAPTAPAYADDAAMCNAALAFGIRDNYALLTERVQFEQYQNRLCDANYETYEGFMERSSSLGLDVKTAKAIIGMNTASSGSSNQFMEKYRQFCQSTYFDSDYTDRFYSYSSNVSEALTRSWQECHKNKTDAFLALNQKGVYIDVMPQDDGFSEFTISVKRKSVVNDDLVITDIHPVGTVQCVRAGQPVETGTKIDIDEFSFSCWKPPYKSVTVSLATSEGASNAVQVPSHTSKINEINERITRENQELRAALNQLQGNISTTESRLQKVGAPGPVLAQPMAGSGAKLWEATSGCPAGYYVSAVRGWDRNGGDPCHNCMTNFAVECSPIVGE